MRNMAALQFKNTELVPVTDAMWNAAWNVVANCNELLNRPPKLTLILFSGLDGERQMILGEAIGLRAFIQFDLLRIYAPSPSSVGFGKDDRTFIPYVNVYPSYVNNHQTVSYCLEQIIADFEGSTAHSEGSGCKHLVWGRTLDSISKRFQRACLQKSRGYSPELLCGNGGVGSCFLVCGKECRGLCRSQENH